MFYLYYVPLSFPLGSISVILIFLVLLAIMECSNYMPILSQVVLLVLILKVVSDHLCFTLSGTLL